MLSRRVPPSQPAFLRASFFPASPLVSPSRLCRRSSDPPQVFHVEDQKLVLVSEKEAKGAVYNLNAFNGRLLAGVNSKLMLYKWPTRDDDTRELVMECSHHGHILALYVAVRGDFICVGDLMKSIVLLVYKPEARARARFSLRLRCALASVFRGDTLFRFLHGSM